MVRISVVSNNDAGCNLCGLLLVLGLDIVEAVEAGDPFFGDRFRGVVGLPDLMRLRFLL